MNRIKTTPWLVLSAAVLLGVVAVTASCGPKQQTAAAVDVEQARKTLEAVLSDWKEGGTPDAWQHKAPRVVVQDLDWAGGAILKSFEFLDKGEARDANLYCKVKIVAANPSKPDVARTVTYVVGTHPVLTVFRDILH